MTAADVLLSVLVALWLGWFAVVARVAYRCSPRGRHHLLMRTRVRVHLGRKTR